GVPAVDADSAPRRDTANAVASLVELNYFSAPHTVFAGGVRDHNGRAVADREPPFSRCVLLPLPREESPTSLQELAALAGDVLGGELTPPLGKVAEQERVRRTGHAPQPRCQTLGSYWFTVPRRLLLQRVARSLCHRLVHSWRSAEPKDTEDKVRQWMAAQL